MIVCRNGVFGGRMRENVLRVGATPVMVDDDFGQPVDPEKVEAALRANPGAKAVAFVHAETSTGARSDAATLSARQAWKCHPTSRWRVSTTSRWHASSTLR